MAARIKRISLPKDRRAICISDIHGNLDLFKALLNKVNYSDADILILLGDIHMKGKQSHESVKYIMKLCQNPDVHVSMGNCDWVEDCFDDAEKEWISNLPHIIDSQDYIFVHGGLTSNVLDEQDEVTCMKNDAFLEQGLVFDKYVIAGHWPTANYTHKIPCFNPIINNESRIISIDGGNVLKPAGQLNAFIIENNNFSFAAVDGLPVIKIENAQPESGGKLNITWLDRFVEPVEEGKEFSIYRHIQTGMTLSLPNCACWTDNSGRLCVCDYCTDYHLPVNVGDTVSVVRKFGSKLFAKINGIAGWIEA